MYRDRILDGRQKPVTNLTFERDTPSTAVIDGHDGMGAVISSQAMSLAIKKSKEVGTGTVVVRNSTHFGTAGYYPLMAVKENMIGICVTNTRPSMAPTFGVQPLLGTNPIAFGAPTDENEPFLYDGATTIIQRGKGEIHARKDKLMPEGYVFDQYGNPAVNPHNILSGLNNDINSLLPLGGRGEEFGGYKGYGLATIVEILSASLQNGNFLTGLMGFSENGKTQPFGFGHFFQAITIDAFTSADEFKKTTGDILRKLRNSKCASGHERIYKAGEKEAGESIKSYRDGIKISRILAVELNQIALKYNLPTYHY